MSLFIKLSLTQVVLQSESTGSISSIAAGVDCFDSIGGNAEPRTDVIIILSKLLTVSNALPAYVGLTNVFESTTFIISDNGWTSKIAAVLGKTDLPTALAGTTNDEISLILSFSPLINETNNGVICSGK